MDQGSGKKTMSVADFCKQTGQVIGRSDWRTITQEMTNTFADLAQDHQFIHVDPARSASGPYGGTIAHGFLTLALIAPMSFDVLPDFSDQEISLNYGFDRVRFVSPVPVGTRFRTTFKLLEGKKRSEREVLLRYEVMIEMEENVRPAIVAEWLVLINLAKSAAAA